MDNENLLIEAKRLFEIHTEIQRVSEGFQNIVYSYGNDGKQKYLRITPSKLRNISRIESELKFIWDYIMEESGSRFRLSQSTEI